MIPVQIRPDRAAKEMLEFNQKLGLGLKNLINIGEISIGATPTEVIYREDKLTLHRYQSPFGEPHNPVPVVVVYALVNRPYMADLQEDRSLVRGMLKAGQDVYLIDWGYPDRADQYLTMDDYINGYLDRSVDTIRRRHGIDKVNMLGICQGGTFSLCYSAIHAHKVKNLITMVTPVDFQTPGDLLSRWVQQIDVDLLVDTMGNVSGDLMNWMFLSLKPFRLMGQKYLDMVDLLDDEEQARNFLRMEKWIFDSPDQVGETFKQFVKGFYQENRLIKGEVQLGAHRVDLRNITMPVLNIYAREDHLVPPPASTALKRYVSTRDYSELDFPGGHIGIYVSGKSQKTVPPAIGEWLDAR
ncbi:MAG TPA: class III poly(R)-hydroxyalkanoic acid synthase subunit PhaC [Gammaproteobacteria bacterium]|nr:class III poly(R)-hydroxyalkanoic acid synthase subunit PhaC [Gammaproteobacteria bacterium]